MSKELMIHKDGKAIYPIYLEQNYDGLGKIFESLNLSKGKALIVTDTNVGSLYAKSVEQLASQFISVVKTITIPAGEAYKNLDTVHTIYQMLIEEKFDRNDVLLALGGGVIGDMTGFTASTYLRGIRFIQLPTSLLAMVDSSIGGKTGVDFQSYKNMIGAFYQPYAVYMNMKTLYTLPDREFYSGFGEIIKHGLIKDKAYYDWLHENATPIRNKEIELLEETIYRSLLVKKQVVENDPYEKGERALLNFGHTIGHSIEKLMNFSMLHGECVSLGIVSASYLSMLENHISRQEYEEIVETLESFHLPVNLEKNLKLSSHIEVNSSVSLEENMKASPEGTLEKTLQAAEVVLATKNDKKMDSGKIKFILLNKIGNAYINRELSDEQITLATQEVL